MNTQQLQAIHRFQLIGTSQFPDIKDPCPVFDGNKWHIYGSAGTVVTEKWQIYHATATSLEGPWTEETPAHMALVGDRVAAPGVVYDEKERMFHMFVQTDFMRPNGTIEHLLSSDGNRFNNFGTILRSIPDSKEAGIYDPHPAIIGGKKYFVYSAMETAKQLSADSPFSIAFPEIYLAKSTSDSWYGPWERVGKILGHEEVPFHNQLDNPHYEWGLEGAQLVELPNGKVLLNAVCFLPEGTWGTRQRVFFAIADSVEGPYKAIGPVLNPIDNSWESGENGHATGVVVDDTLRLFYQARPVGQEYNSWRYGMAVFNVQDIEQTYLSA